MNLPETVDSALARRVAEILRVDATLMSYLKGIEHCELDQLIDYRGAGALPRLYLAVDGFGVEVQEPTHKTGIFFALVTEPERAESFKFERIRAFGRILDLLLASAETNGLDVEPENDGRTYSYAVLRFSQVNLPRLLSGDKSLVLTAARAVITTHQPKFSYYE